MKQYIISLTIITFFPITMGFAQDLDGKPVSHKSDVNLKGEVRSYHEFKTLSKLKNGEYTIPEKPDFERYHRYDQAGILVEEKSVSLYLSKNAMTRYSHNFYTYANGKVIRQYSTREDEDKRNLILFWTYNEDGNITAEGPMNRKDQEELNPDAPYDSLFPSSTYEYDDQGRVIRLNYGNYSWTDYTYSGDGLIVTGTRKKKETGKVIGSTEYTYNEKGRLVSQITQNSLTRITLTKDVYNYDGEGRIIEEISYEEGKFRQKTLTEYDDSGHWKKRTFYDSQNGKPYLIWEFEYNEFGDKTKWTWKRDGGTRITEITWLEYEYDEKGNWVKRTEFSEKNEVPRHLSMLTTRTYDYY